jgi:hypothetical protein
MRASETNTGKLYRLIDRHIELSELFDRRMPPARRAPPVLLTTMSVGKPDAECLVALADRVLAAYEGTSFDQDPSVLALRAALGQTIADMLDKEIPAP